jgi:hypothetical protein
MTRVKAAPQFNLTALSVAGFSESGGRGDWEDWLEIDEGCGFDLDIEVVVDILAQNPLQPSPDAS